MRVRRHFRTSSATINLIICDLNLNRISNKETYLRICVNDRIERLHIAYDNKIDKLLSFLVVHFTIDTMPVESLSKIALSLAKVTNILSKGFLAVIGE